MKRFKLVIVRKYGDVETVDIFAGDFAEMQANDRYTKERKRSANVYVALFEGRKLIKQSRRFQ